MLEKFGFRFKIVNDGKEACEAVAADKYNVVLMDVQMPVMGGFEATRVIRSFEGEVKHTPIIAMTAHAMQGDREKCLMAGMDDYLSKPMKPQHLLAKISQWSRQEKTDVQTSEEEVPMNDKLRQESSIDYDAALDRACGDKEFLLDLIESFLDYIPDIIEALKTAEQSRDSEEVASKAHNIKGAARNLSADRLADVAERIEMKGRSGELSDLSSLLEELNEEAICLEDRLLVIKEEVAI